jgi:signal transduction histidine kinase
MAALGQLVAGVAHEVNTPIGIAITASTGLVQRLDLSRAELNAGRLTRSSIEEFFAYADEAARLVERNLRRAAELIRTFKQVAVDRSADDRRQFELGAFLDELLPSLRLLWKQRPVQFELDCRSPIRFDSYPGALGQIITNFVQNALVHAFKERNGGKMRLSAELGQSGRVFLQFSDDGNGIGDEHLSHIFEPFYTTGRGEGCTGLGLHIVYNLVTEKLGGRIRVDSTLGQGTLFSLDLPLQAPVTAG